jgi:RimJ/RimL family protein N-acetyltransferase
MTDAPTVKLVPVDRSHLEALAALTDDPLVLRYTRVPEPVPAGFAEDWLAFYEAGRRDGTSEAFALLDAVGTFRGIGVAPRIDAASRTAELGYVVVREARGRGIASQALRLLTEWGFAELGAQRLELYISVGNEASKAVARRAGYAREGVMRSVHVKQGRREDVELWSRLPSDP